MIFDASCITSSGIDLNEVLLKGSCIQEEFTYLLTRFRKNKYAMTAVISKIYPQIWVCPKHQSYQRIFWRPNINQAVQGFLLNTIIYGIIPASFLATGCLHRSANEMLYLHPIACAAIK